MPEVTTEAKRDILQRKLALYRGSYYSHEVDAKVAKDIGGMDDIVKAASANMASVRKTIDALEKILAELGDS